MKQRQIDPNLVLMVTELQKPENADLRQAIRNRGEGGTLEESFMFGNPVGHDEMVARLEAIEKKCADCDQWSGGYYGWLMRRTQGELMNIDEGKPTFELNQ